VRITITAKHVKVTPTMKEYAESKIERLDRYFDRIDRIQVLLNKDGMDNVCEINVHTDSHHQLSAVVHNQDDMHAAVDLCLDKIQAQLKKVKEKLKGHKGADRRKKLGRDVKRLTQRLPRVDETSYEDAKNE
jgi:putative sigma-54 modulation protein